MDIENSWDFSENGKGYITGLGNILYYFIISSNGLEP